MATITIDSDAEIFGGVEFDSDAIVGPALAITSDAEIGTPSTTYTIPYTSDAYIAVANPGADGPGTLPKTGCSFSTPCEDPSIPLGNYTSEAPSASTFSGFAFPVTNPNDPINGAVTYQAEGCLSECDSAVSQEDADLCAARQAFVCANTPVTGEGPTFYYSGVQTCRMECPNGDPFIYTLAAGAFVDTNQSLADARALVYACQQASHNAICLGSLPNGCVGSAYSGTLQRNAGGIPPFRFSVVAGALPPGLTFSQVDSLSAALSGTPTTAGSYSFTVQATDTHGNWMNRVMTVCILGASVTALPNGSAGVAYSETLTAPDCATQPLSWQVTSGALPPGLVLDESTGLISGTPTTGGVYSFSVMLQTNAS
jgi:Putative Ig domain